MPDINVAFFFYVVVVGRVALYIKPEWVFLLHLMLLLFSVFFSQHVVYMEAKIQEWL